MGDQEIQRNRSTVILNWTLAVLLFHQCWILTETRKKNTCIKNFPYEVTTSCPISPRHVHNLVTDRQKWDKFQIMSDHNKKGTLHLPGTVHHIHILTTTLDGTFLLQQIKISQSICSSLFLCFVLKIYYSIFLLKLQNYKFILKTYSKILGLFCYLYHYFFEVSLGGNKW